MSDRIRLMIADDHPVVRHGLRRFLETCPDVEVVAEVEDGQQAVEQAQECLPDVVLMDLRMPRMDGVEAIDQITRTSPSTHIVVLTSYPEDEYLYPAMRAGAHGYLLKDVQPESLLLAIRAAARGQASLHPLVAARLVEGARDPDAAPAAELSERELDVLRWVAKGLNNREIADRLVIAEGTVKSHVSNILSKLHLAHRTQAALYALKRKLVSLQDLPPSTVDHS